MSVVASDPVLRSPVTAIMGGLTWLLHGLLAITAGLMLASALNALALTVFMALQSGSDGAGAGFLVLAIYGPLVMAPAWILFCLVVLPVATHRMAYHGIGFRRYMIAMTVAGGVSAMLFGAFVAIAGVAPRRGDVLVLLSVVAGFGAVGGASIAAMWHLLILRPMRRILNGAVCG